MQKNFSLETILSIITGFIFTNYKDVYDLYGFIMEKEDFDDKYFIENYNKVRNHIVNLYPNLSNISLDATRNLNEWLNEQKALFGDTLTISVIGEKVIKLKK